MDDIVSYKLHELKGRSEIMKSTIEWNEFEWNLCDEDNELDVRTAIIKREER